MSLLSHALGQRPGNPTPATTGAPTGNPGTAQEVRVHLFPPTLCNGIDCGMLSFNRWSLLWREVCVHWRSEHSQGFIRA